MDQLHPPNFQTIPAFSVFRPFVLKQFDPEWKASVPKMSTSFPPFLSSELFERLKLINYPWRTLICFSTINFSPANVYVLPTGTGRGSWETGAIFGGSLLLCCSFGGKIPLIGQKLGVFHAYSFPIWTVESEMNEWTEKKNLEKYISNHTASNMHAYTFKYTTCIRLHSQTCTETCNTVQAPIIFYAGVCTCIMARSSTRTTSGLKTKTIQ